MGPMWTTTIGDKVIVTKTCAICRAEASVTVDRDAFDRWQAGEHAQVAFPDVPAAEREILISGTHPACWDAMFAGDDDE